MRIASLLSLLVVAIIRSPDLQAQGREKQIECSFLLLSGCRNYIIHVIRVEPGGGEQPQTEADTYQLVDPDTLDPAAYLVLELYEQDRLSGKRSFIWVERQSGAVGGDWASKLSNDAVRSAELRGVPGDVVELYNDRTLRPGRGLTRLVIFAGQSSCRTAANLNSSERGCSVLEGRGTAGKVSGIVIRYRAPSALPSERLSAGGKRGAARAPNAKRVASSVSSLAS